MKLKYYLRGLGIGIILTTLILTISRINHKMSDQEIINKAMELGMVMKEDPKGNLDEVLEQEKTEKSDTPEGSPSPAPEASQAPEATPAVTPVASGENAGTNASDPSKENATDAASTEPDSTQTDLTTGDTTQAAEEASDTTQVTKEPGTEPADNGAATDVTGGSEEITFTIEKGMSSGKVSTLLETKGLVENAGDFNNYIIQEGKSGVIRVGTFTVTKGSSYAEILTKITSRE